MESMAFMATKAGDMPGKRPPKVANGLGKLRGENKDSEGGGRLGVAGGGFLVLLNISRVNPGYKKGRIGSISGVISSFSRSLLLERLPESLLALSLASRDETEKMLGFLVTVWGVERTG